MRYHNKIVVLFFFIWGIIGLERMVVGFVLPSIATDFNLNLTEAGIVVSAFSFAYAFGTSILGGVTSSGIIGKKITMVLLVFLGGVLSWLSGIATTVAFLVGVRIVMGFCEGGVYPCLMPTILEESPENVRGRNVGLMTTGMMILGSILGPIISSQLLIRFGSWRPVFYLYAVPAIVLAIITWFVMREPPSTAALIKARKEGTAKVKTLDAEGNEISLLSMLKYRNIVLMVFTWICQMAWLWMITSFGIMYLTSFHGISLAAIGGMMAAFGVGAAIGPAFFGGMSDRLGRKRTLVLTQVLGTAFGIAFVVVNPGISPFILAGLLAMWGFFVAGSGGINSAIPGETVGFALAGAAMGLCVGAGELIGGGIIPILAGRLGDIMGLRATMWLAVALVAVCVFLALGLKDIKAISAVSNEQPE